jgi:hypothetical protein
MVHRNSTALVLAAALACGGDDEGKDELEPAPVAEQARDDEEPDEAVLGPTQRRRAYLAAWSQCLHATAGRIEQAWKRYGLTVDAQTGLPRDKEKAPFIHRVSVQLEACRVGDPPEGIDPALHEAGQQYVEAASAVAAFTRELADYYDAEGYTEDAWARGAESAPAFKAAYDAFTVERAAFGRLLDTTRADVDQAWLGELEAAHDEGLRFRLARIALWGRTVAACIAREETPHTACSTAAGDFHEVTEELDAYCREHPAEAVGVFWLDVLRRKAQILDEVVRAATAPPPKTRPSKPRDKAGASSDPQRKAVADAFADFVLATDRVRFDFP